MLGRELSLKGVSVMRGQRLVLEEIEASLRRGTGRGKEGETSGVGCACVCARGDRTSGSI